MFDLGIQELIVIFIVALLVFGPKKLPELAASLGKVVRDIRQAMSGVKEQLDSEIREIKDPLTLKNDMYKDNQLFKDEYKASEEVAINKTSDSDKYKTISDQDTSSIPSDIKDQNKADDKGKR